MNLHLTLQGKGGVGKSLVSTLVAQYLRSQGDEPTCIDTDPANATFHGFSQLNVKFLDILENEKVNPRIFDQMVNTVMTSENDCVVDCGATTFIPLTAYIKENNLIEFLTSSGITVYMHVLVTGGQALKDTIKGLDYIIKSFSDNAKIVVWLNEFFGKVMHDGKEFEEFKVFIDNKKEIYGLITIPEMTRETFGQDIKEMLEKRMTFNEFISDENIFAMPRQRITIFRDKIYNNISMVL